MKTADSTAPPPGARTADASGESLQQPLWHILVLSVLTLFAYPLYWFYKTWRDLKQQARRQGDSAAAPLSSFKEINPFLRAAATLVPLLQIYLAFTLFKAVAQLNPDHNSLARRHPALAAILLVAAMLALINLPALLGQFVAPPAAADKARLSPLILLSYGGALPLAVAQSWLNAYWQALEPPDVVVRQAFSACELVAIIAGSLVLGLVLASFLI